MTNAPDIVYVGPAMDADGKPTWGGDWVQIGDWDTSLDGLTFAEHGKRFVDAGLYAELMRVADELAYLISEPVAVHNYKGWLIRRGATLTAYRKAKEKLNAL